MKKELSKIDARKNVEKYFAKSVLSPEKTKKIKRLAMKYKICLENNRKRFCKKCLRDLKFGNVRITKSHKTVECGCGFKNKFKIN